MIKIKILQQNDVVIKIQIKGHADFDESGKDLVCASVSSISVGLLNAISEKNYDVDMTMDEGLINIEVLDLNNTDLQLMLFVAIIQLKTIEESYSKYIRIEKEVTK